MYLKINCCFFTFVLFCGIMCIELKKNSSIEISSSQVTERNSSNEDRRWSVTNHVITEAATVDNESIDDNNSVISIVTLPSLRSSFKDDEKVLTKSIDHLMRQLLPVIMRSSSSSKALSARCMSSLMKIFMGVRKLKGWALSYVDSFGKPSSGILEGNYFSMGHYDQCLSISVSKKGEDMMKLANKEEQDLLFQGQYCVIRLKQSESVIDTARNYHKRKIDAEFLGKLREMIEVTAFSSSIPNYMNHLLGICAPSTCNQEDVAHIVQNIPFPGEASVEICETQKEKQVTVGQKAAIAIFVLLGAMVAIGSTVDKLFQVYAGRDYHSMTENKCISIVTSFSIFSNTRKLMEKIQNDSVEDPDSRCIRGLVFGAVICLIIHHTYFPPFSAYYKQASNLSNLKNYMEKAYFAITICLPMAIETLFMAYGFTLSNKIWKSTYKKKSPVKVQVVAVMIIHYLRLCVPILFCLGIIVLLPLTGSGPLWNEVFESAAEKCVRNWWSLLGMYSNFLQMEDQCFPHLWFAPCLMQLIIFGIFLLWFTSRWPKLGVCLTISLICICNCIVGVLTTQAHLPPAYVEYFSESKTSFFWHINYALPVCHFGSFAIGILLGIFMARRTRLQIKSVLPILGWMLSAAMVIGACVFVVHNLREVESSSSVSSGVYAALHRTVYSLSIAWIVLACSYGYGSSIGSLLSWSVLSPLYKMSYFAYLLHVIVIGYNIGTAREKDNYSHSNIIMKCISYAFLSYTAAYLCHIFAEMPLKMVCQRVYPTRSSELRITSTVNGASKIDPEHAYYEHTLSPRMSVVAVSNHMNGNHSSRALQY